MGRKNRKTREEEDAEEAERIRLMNEEHQKELEKAEAAEAAAEEAAAAAAAEEEEETAAVAADGDEAEEKSEELEGPQDGGAGNEETSTAITVEGGFLAQLLMKLRPYAPGGDQESALFALLFTILSVLAGAAALKAVDEAWDAGTEAREEAAFLAIQAEKEAAKAAKRAEKEAEEAAAAEEEAAAQAEYEAAVAEAAERSPTELYCPQVLDPPPCAPCHSPFTTVTNPDRPLTDPFATTSPRLASYPPRTFNTHPHRTD